MVTGLSTIPRPRQTRRSTSGHVVFVPFPDQFSLPVPLPGVEAWDCMIHAPDNSERDDLGRQLLQYCKLDSLAMVQIHAWVVRKVGREVEAHADC